MNLERIIEEFHQGHSLNAYEVFGAHFVDEGVRFTVYAPHAENVWVVGSFTNWDENQILMERMNFQGVWTITVPSLNEWEVYKYKIQTRTGNILYKADPFAFYSETRPNTASKLVDLSKLSWTDEKWLNNRSLNFDKPMNIYELYVGGWKRNGEHPYSYDMLADELIPYIKENGYTHIELMPLSEYPFDGSWGYQVSGYYSLTSRYGNPKEFNRFVDRCHAAGIGIIIDMVPVHFVKDDFGLRYFDGEALYEYPNEYDANSEWGTMNFNLWNEEVRSFLMSSAAFWVNMYHMDGIRIDAVSNLIYWAGNRDRGTNDGAIYFVKRLNYYMHKEFPTVMMIAEDSSDFPNVTAPTEKDGLGFDYKWDLGWMNDTLKYYGTDPIYRYYDHHKLTFSMAYFYSEKFLMPFSHDENVHGKHTVIDRMWGDYDAKFAQAKNLYAYMYAHPGKKLNFMGNELGSFREFDETREIDWELLQYPKHYSFNLFIKKLNELYLSHACLYEADYSYDGFKWIDADNNVQSVYSFYRSSKDEYLVCVLNLSNTTYESFELEMPQSGYYKEILNSDNQIYGGNGMVHPRAIRTSKKTGKNLLKMNLAPFTAIWFVAKKNRGKK